MCQEEVDNFTWTTPTKTAYLGTLVTVFSDSWSIIATRGGSNNNSVLYSFFSIWTFHLSIKIRINNIVKDLITYAPNYQLILPWTEDLNWLSEGCSEDVQEVFCTSYVLSIFVLFPVGLDCIKPSLVREFV